MSALGSWFLLFMWSRSCQFLPHVVSGAASSLWGAARSLTVAAQVDNPGSLWVKSLLALSTGRTRPWSQVSSVVPTGSCSAPELAEECCLPLPEAVLPLVTDRAAPDERGRGVPVGGGWEGTLQVGMILWIPQILL